MLGRQPLATLSLSHDTSNFRQDEQDLQGYIGGFQWFNPANPVHPVKVIGDEICALTNSLNQVPTK